MSRAKGEELSFLVDNGTTVNVNMEDVSVVRLHLVHRSDAHLFGLAGLLLLYCISSSFAINFITNYLFDFLLLFPGLQHDADYGPSFTSVIILFAFPHYLFTKPSSSVHLLAESSTFLLNLSLFTNYFPTSCYSLLTFILFVTFLQMLLHKCPKSFTLGEAVIISQAVSLTAAGTLNSLVNSASEEQSFTFVQCLLLGIAFFAVALSTSQKLWGTFSFYSLFVATIGGTLILMAVKLNENPIFWLLNFILQNSNRVALIFYWVLCTLIAIFVLAFCREAEIRKPLTVIRKYFHVIVVSIFLPGIVFDMELLFLASVVALSAFIILEAFRLCETPPLGHLLTENLKGFLDEKDQGILILTHIYLLVGCSLPVWLNPNFAPKLSYDQFLLASSGIVSLGIGDTAASICGTYFGVNKWPNSTKSLEGTACSVIAQLIFGLLVNCSGYFYVDMLIQSTLYCMGLNLLGSRSIRVVTLASTFMFLLIFVDGSSQ
nr:EOG090X0BFL [Eulimnadia texana]